MKKHYLLLLLAFATIGQAFSQSALRINEPQARRMAQDFVNTNHQRFQVSDLELVSASNIFVYNVGRQGFVIVSGNTVLPPILGYSDNGVFPDLSEAPENVAAWIGHYEDMIAFAEEQGLQPEAEIQQQWDEAKKGLFGNRNAQSVTPLVSTRWNQDCYYNEYCPATSGDWWDGGPCGHVYAGCVACAMAQVMKYWEHPATGFGSHSYTHATYGQLSANFAATTYHWDEMPEEIFDHNDAVATLMYHCGVSVNMNYSASGSGAQSTDVETALRSYFGYCGAKYRQKSNYDDNNWTALLKAELDMARPVYYSGVNGNSGHAFVCDGYDSNDLFHFNFGWSGSSDGHYSIYDVNGFNSGQAAVTNIHPVDIQPDGNGIIYVSENGTGNGSSWAEATGRLEYAAALSSGGGTTVWVKKGTYYGDTNDANSAFYITASNRVYGSFKGDESPDYDLSQRDFVNNASILDGQGSRRVLTQEKTLTGGAAVWDGFVIRNGKAGSGAGAYVGDYTTLANCTITNNTATMFGGGLYANSGGSSPHVSIVNCTIADNSASMGGGVCDRIGANYTNCLISNNIASTKGGGLYLYNNIEPTFKNCVVSNNTAKNAGGMYARGKFTAYNCNFVMNLATESTGGIFIENHYSKACNCILWGNESNGVPSQTEGTFVIDYCAIQDGEEGNGNLCLEKTNDGMEPGLFVRFSHPSEGSGADFRNGDWNLQSGSICLNAGKPNTTGLGNTDIAGNQRIQKGRVEIGAYESCASLTEQEDILLEGAPYYFNGLALSKPGSYTAVIPTAECDSVVRLTLTTPLGMADLPSASFGAWPNPTKNVLHIEAEGDFTLEIRNLLGQLLMQAENTQTIDFEELERGVYFLILDNNKGEKRVIKVLKE